MTARSIIISFAILAGLLVCPETGLTVEQNVVQTEEEAAGRAAEEVAEKAAERAAEKVVEKLAEKIVEKEERPDKWKGPTEVHFFVFIIDIDNIDGAAQSFTANFVVFLRWKDERLAQDTTSMRRIPLDEVWNPRVILVNPGGIVQSSLPKVVEVSPDGAVIYRQRYVGTLSQPLELSMFPMDEHRFAIQFVAVGSQAEDLAFVPEVSLVDADVEITGGGFQSNYRYQTGRW